MHIERAEPEIQQPVQQQLIDIQAPNAVMQAIELEEDDDDQDLQTGLDVEIDDLMESAQWHDEENEQMRDSASQHTPIINPASRALFPLAMPRGARIIFP